MSYVLITDSSADLPWNYYREHNIPFIPLTVTIGDEDFPDDGSVDSHQFYERLRNGEVASTSQIGVMSFVDCFEPYLEEGKDILFMGLSAGLSGSYQNACLAASELKERYPDRTVHVVQSSSVTLGLGIQIHEARVRRDEGMSFTDLCNWLEETYLTANHLFTVDDLMFLHRGGRLSKTSAVVGSLLGIKPLLHVSPEGKLISDTKVRGRRQALLGLVNGMADVSDAQEYTTIGLTHGDCEEEAIFVMDEIKKRYTVHLDFIRDLGPTIGAHSGPGTMALFFYGKKRIR